MRMAVILVWVAVYNIPVIEDALWESSSWCFGSQVLSESERLCDWQVGLDKLEWGAWNDFFVNVFTSSLVECGVDSTDGFFWWLDFDQEDWLLKSWLTIQVGSKHRASWGWDDLSCSSVDGVGVQGYIDDVESDSSHVFVGQWGFFSNPLEGVVDRVLDFGQVLSGLSLVDQDIWSLVVWTEEPDLLSFIRVPVELIDESLVSLLNVGLWRDLFIFDFVSKLVSEHLTFDLYSVVLVRRLGKTSNWLFFDGDGFFVWDDWVGLDDRDSCVFFEILETDFDVEFSASGNDVLSSWGVCALNEWIWFWKSLQSFDELWQVGSALILDCNSDDWWHWVLHDSDVVSRFRGWDGSLFDQELIDSYESAGVTAWNVWHLLDFTSHHKNDSLDALDVDVSYASWSVVWPHNSDFFSRFSDIWEYFT